MAFSSLGLFKCFIIILSLESRWRESQEPASRYTLLNIRTLIGLAPFRTLYPYQATALLTAVGPVVPTAVELVPSLVEALAGDTGVALRAAEKISAGVLAVAGCPPAENPPVLRGHIALTSITNCQTATQIRSQGVSISIYLKGHIFAISGNTKFLTYLMLPPTRTGSCQLRGIPQIPVRSQFLPLHGSNTAWIWEYCFPVSS